MPTNAEILAYEQMRRQNTPLAQLANIGQSIFGAYKQRQMREQEQQKIKATEQGEVQAANFLNQAVQNPDQAEQLFLKAYQASPDFVSKFMQASKNRREVSSGGMTDYQAESVRLRKEQIELDKLKNAQMRETNDLRRQQLEQKIQATEQKINQDQKKIESSIRSDFEAIDTTLNTVKQLSNHPGLEAAVGGSSILPTRPGSDAANFESRLEQLKSQQFLSEVQKMKGLGALSENEGKKLAAAASALDLRMSEDEFRKELKYIEDTMTKARNKIAGKLPSEEAEAEDIIDWGSM